MMKRVRNIKIIATSQIKIRTASDINGEKDKMSPMIE